MSLTDGDLVVKKAGYKFRGVILTVFETTEGLKRCVVEMAETPMLHIFNLDQLRLALPDEADEIAKTLEERK